jgi:hypothetical protein
LTFSCKAPSGRVIFNDRPVSAGSIEFSSGVAKLAPLLHHYCGTGSTGFALGWRRTRLQRAQPNRSAIHGSSSLLISAMLWLSCLFGPVPMAEKSYG